MATTLNNFGSKQAGGRGFKSPWGHFIMINKKEFSEILKKSEIKQIENTFRQIAEEKPYLLSEFKEEKFYT